MAICTFLLLYFVTYCQAQTKKYVERVPPAKYANPNFVRDRLKNVIIKPFINETWQNRFDKPFHPAWMDYCDPYHCNDYHKTACGLNRKRMKFKWFQSGCHIALNNLCAAYRGNLKYDMIDAKFCIHYTIFLRSGCPASCTDNDVIPVCAVSSIDNHIVLFKNVCALDTANCREGVLQALTLQTLPEPYKLDQLKKVNKKVRDVLNLNYVLSPTPTLQQRILLLKSKLLNDGHGEHPSMFDDSDDDNEFLLEPITIARTYKKYKMRNASMPSPNITTTNSPAKRQGLRPFLKSQANKKKKDKLFLNPMDIFYRRLIGEQFKDETWRMAMCQDIITPFLTGVKKGPMEMTKIGIKDPMPERLFHLLSVNMSGHAKDDVFAMMHQISRVQIRLYQWDVMPIRVLINLLVKGKPHTFRNLKASMREMFANWHLDFRNLTKIIEHTRIIRPPCTVTSQYTGSTKTAKVSRYKEYKTTTPNNNYMN